MVNTPKYLALISAVSLSFFAAACGSGDGGSGEAATGTDAATESHSATGAHGADGADNPNADIPGPENLDGMTEVNASGYTGNGSGINAGTHFTSTDGSIVCGITDAMAACHVGGNTIQWDPADRAEDGLGGDMVFSDMIGWNPGVHADFGEKPKTWLLQGQFAPIAVELDDNTKLTVQVSSGGTSTEFTCGTKDDRMTCVSGDHGFTVSVAGYRVW